MDVWEAIEKRRSIRKYKDIPVPPEHLIELVEAAVKAPSAGNRQMWKFVAVTNKEINDRCSLAVTQKIDHFVDKFRMTASVENWKWYSSFFNEAPAVIYVFYKKTKGFLERAAGQSISEKEMHRLRANPDIQSIGGAVENLLLAAVKRGYGTCWMTAPVIAALEIEEILGTAPPWQLSAVIPVGVPAEDPQERPKKPFEEVFELIE